MAAVMVVCSLGFDSQTATMFTPSPQQAVVANFDKRPYPDYAGQCYHHIVYGPWGTGKTAVCVRALVKWACLKCSGEKFILSAKTQLQLNEEMKEPIEEFLDDLGIYDESRLVGKSWKIPSFAGRRPNTFLTAVFGEGENPAKRVKGLNLRGGVVDEGNLMNPVMRWELVSRFRRPGAHALWTLNPYLDEFKEEFVDLIADGDLLGEVVHLKRGANPTLDDEYYSQMAAQLPFEWQRKIFIDGVWAAPGGLIFIGATVSHLDGGNLRDLPDGVNVRRYVVGFDWASKNVSHAVSDRGDGRRRILHRR